MLRNSWHHRVELSSERMPQTMRVTKHRNVSVRRGLSAIAQLLNIVRGVIGRWRPTSADAAAAVAEAVAY